MNPNALNRLIAPLYRRVMLMVGRAVVQLVDDAGGLQRVQVTLLGSEVRDQVDRLQQYGLTSVPGAGSEAVVVCVGGNRDNPVAVVVDESSSRPTGLKDGEVCVYSRHGQRVHLREDGSVLISPKPGQKVLVGGEDGSFKPVARVGDRVNITSGSSAGLNGVIHEGSSIMEVA